MSVALVLIPQAMAYAQLAGLPVYYGLYAAFLPVLVGAMWGCSHQLATGPVAMVSLLTGATLAQYAAPAQFEDQTARQVIEDVLATGRTVTQLQAAVADKTAALQKLEKAQERGHPRVLALQYDIEVLQFDVKAAEREHRLRARELRHFAFKRAQGAEASADRFYLEGMVPSDVTTGIRRWRFSRLAGERLVLSGGGEVVGAIPAGLPSLSLPRLAWDTVILLFSSAFVITLVGFMEALSIARAMAVKTRQRIDPDQELIGQGLANIAGSLTFSFPVSGSFSRSAVNLSAGAVTGMSSVFTWLVALATLLYLTPLLYHLPQAVLAAIVTFAATLAFAPHLDTGILIGAGLAIVLHLFRTMSPRVALLGRHADGTLRDARLHGLATSEHIIAARFDGSLYFANVPRFEDAILAEVAAQPRASYALIVGDGINQIDASGEEAVRHLGERLRANGIGVAFSGLKQQVSQVMQNTGLYQLIGERDLFRTEEHALDAIHTRITAPGFDPASCPLRRR